MALGLKLQPSQPEAQHEFDRCLSGGMPGVKRYVEWKRIILACFEDIANNCRLQAVQSTRPCRHGYLHILHAANAGENSLQLINQSVLKPFMQHHPVPVLV